MQAKQSAIDSIHAQLRESSALLGEERRRLDRLRLRAKESSERKQRISNLRKAAEEERYRLQHMQHQHGHMANGDVDLHLGDADKPFIPLSTIMSPDMTIHPSHLPPASVLRAQLHAYTSNNSFLESEVRGLKSKSRDLEAKYRRIIQLCTGVEEDKIEGVLGNLTRAVESERGDVELGRVREFLQKVEGVE
jgi:regulatory protein SWI6